MVPLPGDQNRTPDEMSFEEIEHELRTPLASIRSLSEIMRDYPDLTEDQRRRFLEVLLVENERLARTVEQLLGSIVLQKALS
ncbi:histidine kinase dimerization/phospho-acceptor domain-containing protein [Benzoatithermus flavus]|uniref:histidine kinase n=1 Tax=Benzoatithermus flavus TaxID=3108223 RepID=A0ABU8XT20_9PROT